MMGQFHESGLGRPGLSSRPSLEVTCFRLGLGKPSLTALPNFMKEDKPGNIQNRSNSVVNRPISIFVPDGHC